MTLMSLFNTPLSLVSVTWGALLIQTFCTFAMTGLIWLIQGVHYPLMAKVGETNFVEYVHLHARQITMIVGPLMVIEVATVLMCLYWGKQIGLPMWTTWLGLGLVFVIWASTAFFSVPCHETLAGGFDLPTIERLVQTNWIRTIAWTLRSILLLGVLWYLMIGRTASHG